MILCDCFEDIGYLNIIFSVNIYFCVQSNESCLKHRLGNDLVQCFELYGVYCSNQGKVTAV